jgi:hypothetical protein
MANDTVVRLNELYNSLQEHRRLCKENMLEIKRICKTYNLGTPGYVYALITADNSMIKIGYTASPYTGRIRTVNSHNPQRLKLVMFTKMLVNALQLEKELHTKLLDKKIDREWFDYTNDTIETLCQFSEQHNEGLAYHPSIWPALTMQAGLHKVSFFSH